MASSFPCAPQNELELAQEKCLLVSPKLNSCSVSAVGERHPGPQAVRPAASPRRDRRSAISMGVGSRVGARVEGSYRAIQELHWVIVLRWRLGSCRFWSDTASVDRLGFESLQKKSQGS